MEMAKSLLKDNKLKLIINTPSPIKSNNIGVLSNKNKTLTYIASLDKFLSKDKIVLKISW